MSNFSTCFANGGSFRDLFLASPRVLPCALVILVEDIFIRPLALALPAALKVEWSSPNVKYDYTGVNFINHVTTERKP